MEPMAFGNEFLVTDLENVGCTGSIREKSYNSVPWDQNLKDVNFQK